MSFFKKNTQKSLHLSDTYLSTCYVPGVLDALVSKMNIWSFVELYILVFFFFLKTNKTLPSYSWLANLYLIFNISFSLE